MLKIAPMLTTEGLKDDTFAAPTNPKHHTTQQTTRNKFISNYNDFPFNFLFFFCIHSLLPAPDSQDKATILLHPRNMARRKSNGNLVQTTSHRKIFQNFKCFVSHFVKTQKRVRYGSQKNNIQALILRNLEVVSGKVSNLLKRKQKEIWLCLVLECKQTQEIQQWY